MSLRDGRKSPCDGRAGQAFQRADKKPGIKCENKLKGKRS